MSQPAPCGRATPRWSVAGQSSAGRVFSTIDLERFFGVDQDTRGVGTKSERGAEFAGELG